MSTLDEISSCIREQLLLYIGRTDTDDMRHNITQSVVKIIDQVQQKFDNVWVDDALEVGDLVEARNYQGLILESDDQNKSLFAWNGVISFTLILPGNPLLVLATDGRESGKIRVVSTFSGEVGWTSISNLRPFVS